MKKLFYIGLGYLLCEATKTETGQKVTTYLKKKGTEFVSAAKERLNKIVSEDEDQPEENQEENPGA
jgi:hypothetical protein